MNYLQEEEKSAEKETDYPGGLPEEVAGTSSAGVKKKPGLWGKLLIGFLCVAMLAAASYAAFTYVPEVRYRAAVFFSDVGWHSEAVKQFEILGDYKNSNRLRHQAEREVLYKEAAALAQQMKYEQALNVYKLISGFRDVDDRIAELQYLYAVQLQESGEYELALTYYLALGDHLDAEERVLETTYLQAGTLAAAGEYEKAREIYRDLGGYRDAAELVDEMEYCRAGALAAEGLIEDAVAVYISLGDYRDSRDQIPKIRYDYAVKLRDENRFDEALQFFEQAGDYLDAPAQMIETKYCAAKFHIEQEKWDAAEAALKEISGYQDADALLVVVEQENLYARALARLEMEWYDGAIELFSQLGDFRDAPQQIEQCRRLKEVSLIYIQAADLYNRFYWAEAAGLFMDIYEDDYKNTQAMVRNMRNTSESNARNAIESGERATALALIEILEVLDGELAAQLLSEMPAETLKPDDSRYHLKTSHITSYSSKTTAAEFASVFIYMYLNGVTKLTLYSSEYTDYNKMLNRALAGCEMANELLYGYASIFSSWIYAEEYMMEITMKASTHQYSISKCHQHVKDFEKFCEDSLQALIDAGLVSGSMTRQERAEIICEWVAFYLDYDDSKVIHDTAVAIEKNLGVCECYTAIYNRMCNLAGIPTFAQVGDAQEAHVWTIQVDEDGSIVYTDVTWFDSDYIPDITVEQPTMEAFIDMLWLRYIQEILDTRPSYSIDWDEIFSVYDWQYFWQPKIWETHTSDRSAKAIIDFYNRVAA